MYIENNTAKDLKITYVGGGSRGWAWNLMSDLAQADDMSGTVCLYDIDKEAAKHNEIIGNSIPKDNFKYETADTLETALAGADFVVISILPGTFDEMESDVHYPEKYGIYQSVGDTTGPGGVVRAMRALPMFTEIAEGIKKCCPNAWVINYTNPMALCVAELYRTFPQIKAFGCCHEVFGTQEILCGAIEEVLGEKLKRQEIYTNVVGVNHFTWITEAKYKNHDLFEIYSKYIENHPEGVTTDKGENWLNKFFGSAQAVKFELYCPGNWFLKDPETVDSWKFGLTPVSWRKNEDLGNRLEKSRKLYTGEVEFELKETGEEGVDQIRALLGLKDMVTNVNLPNVGQIPNVPLGVIVETNAVFSADTVKPQMAGEIPTNVMSIMYPAIANQTVILQAAAERSFKKALTAVMTDNLSARLTPVQAKEMLEAMLENTKKYLPKEWNL